MVRWREQQGREPGWSGDGNSRTGNLDGQVTGTAGQWLWAPGTARLPAKGLYNQIHEGHCSASSRFSKWRCSDWTSLVGKFVLSYCFSWYRDSRSDDPGRKQLKSESFCSLSLSHMDWFREGNSVSPPCVWLLQPSALGNRIFLSSQTDRLSFHLYENKEVELNDLSSFPIFCSFFFFFLELGLQNKLVLPSI